MTATADTRKRTREDDNCDSMPLSKRINNLHINNNIGNFHFDQQSQNGILGNHHHQNLNNDQQYLINQQQQYHQQNLSQTQQHQQHPECLNPSHPSGLGNFQNANEILLGDYNPELDQNENPIYYNKNKLLYELHAERLRRGHQ